MLKTSKRGWLLPFALFLENFNYVLIDAFSREYKSNASPTFFEKLSAPTKSINLSETNNWVRNYFYLA